MSSPILSAIAAAIAAVAVIVGALSDFVSHDQPFGWLGSLLLAALGGLTLWRAGSVKAWKETAEARAGRLEDVERELGALRSELSIPERIEGIIELMSEQAKRSDAAANTRLEGALARLDQQWQRHHEAAEERTARLVAILERFDRA